MRQNEILKNDLSKYAQKYTGDKQQLKLRLNEKEIQITNLKHESDNKEYALREEQNRVNDLQQQINVLQQVVEDYDHLKEADGKLQLEYQKLLHDILEARKEKTLVEQQFNASRNHIQELEINFRQINHEKMGALSEVRAMKQVFEQERKNVSDRYERMVRKLEAEVAYAKKMYQVMKGKYRDLKNKLQIDQPHYEQLKQAIDAERDGFQLKLNDVVIEHVSNLDMISQQSNVAVQSTKWIQDVGKDDSERLSDVNELNDQSAIDTNDTKKLGSIWEPN
eukprot:162471_1